MFMHLPASAGERLTIFAAASLKGALDQVLVLYDRPVTVSYGGSGLIARQVALGAPADVVILANQNWMDWLISQGQPKILMEKAFLGNSLVMIAPVGAAPLAQVSPDTMLGKLGDGRLAIGMTQSVPAGIYARQWLENSALWPELEPRLAETDNVRAALALVARGEAPLGVVYGSDAQADSAVQVVYEIPPKLHDPIVYPIAVIDNSNAVLASDLAGFMSSAQSIDVFVNHGFSPMEPSP